MVLPLIGNKPITELEPKHLYEALKHFQEHYSVGLGHKCKQYINGVFSFALVLGIVTRNPVSDLSGLLKAKLPCNRRSERTCRILKAVESYTGTVVVKAALKLTPMLLLRPGELRQLEWSFINWDESRIEIPARLMKMSADRP